MRESRARRLKEKSRKYFDGVVRDQFMILEPGKCYQQVFEKLREFDINDGKIMDVGCGTGALLGILSEQLPGTDLYGLDISPVSIAAAREKVPAAHFDEGDGEDIPFPDEFAGAVLCTHCFHHFPDPEKALREIFRITQKGGVFILVENSYSDLRRFAENLYLKIRNHKCGDIRFYSEKELVSMMENAGFIQITHSLIAEHSILLTGKKP